MGYITHRIGDNRKRSYQWTHADQNSLETELKLFNCHLSPAGRQMAIENSVSNYFDKYSSIVLTFSIAAGVSIMRSNQGEREVYLPQMTFLYEEQQEK